MTDDRWGQDSGEEWPVPGFAASMAGDVRDEVARYHACEDCSGASKSCRTCFGGSFRDWSHAYAFGWRVRKVEIRPVPRG